MVLVAKQHIAGAIHPFASFQEKRLSVPIIHFFLLAFQINFITKKVSLNELTIHFNNNETIVICFTFSNLYTYNSQEKKVSDSTYTSFTARNN